MSKVDEYLKNINPSQKTHYDRIRSIVMKHVPAAEVTVSYGIPTFKYKGKYVIYFAAFKNHMSVYPVSEKLVEKFGNEVERFRTGKGTLQFSEENPIPNHLIEAMVRLRVEELKK